jgi:hypothetical protein
MKDMALTDRLDRSPRHIKRSTTTIWRSDIGQDRCEYLGWASAIDFRGMRWAIELRSISPQIFGALGVAIPVVVLLGRWLNPRLEIGYVL